MTALRQHKQALGIFCFSFLIYSYALYPGLLPADNGEFQTIVPQLGLLHPTGFPLYTFLGYLFGKLFFFLSAANQLNLFAAFTSSLTLAFLFATVYTISPKEKMLISLTAVFTLASSPTFWNQATTANIRSLTTLFAIIWFYLFIHWQKETDSRKKERWLIALAFFIPLGVAHHISLAFIGLLLVGTIFIQEPTLLRQPARWIKPIGATLAALIPYLYLPWRAAANAPGATADLLALPSFLTYITGRGFQGDFFYFHTPELLWYRFEVMHTVWRFQFSLPLLLLILLGTLLLLYQQKRIGLILFTSILLHTFITATYRAPQTVEYMMPAYLLAALLISGLGFLPTIKRPFQTPLFLLLIFIPLTQTIKQFPTYPPISQTYEKMNNLVINAPPNSLILADWHWYTPLTYLQQIDNKRPDLTIRFVYPREKEYAETWVDEIETALNKNTPVIATHFDPATFHQLPNPIPYEDAFLYLPQPIRELPPSFTPLSLNLDNQIELLGYELARPTYQLDEELQLTVAWQQTSATPVTLFAHLLDTNGRSWSQQDIPLNNQPHIQFTPFRLTPRPGAAPGSFDLIVGAYSDQPLLNELGQPHSSLLSVELTPSSRLPFTQNPISIQMENGQTLRGFDWDTTALPPRLYLHWAFPSNPPTYWTEVQDNQASLPPISAWQRPFAIPTPQETDHYVPLGQGIVWLGGGLHETPITDPTQPLWLKPTFAVNQSLVTDLVISVRLIGYETDGFHWAWTDLNDSIPAMGAIPTLKWIKGTNLSSPHRLIISPNYQPGQKIGATLLLYDAFTGRPLPILDERLTNQAPWIPLGTTTILP